MPLPASDMRQLVIRLADRRAGRTEANVQSDLHMLLAAGPLDLGDDKVQDIILESPAGQRRRIDVETGFTVFEVKRDLRTGKSARTPSSSWPGMSPPARKPCSSGTSVSSPTGLSGTCTAWPVTS
jgi:hypothetical protein